MPDVNDTKTLDILSPAERYPWQCLTIKGSGDATTDSRFLEGNLRDLGIHGDYGQIIAI